MSVTVAGLPDVCKADAPSRPGWAAVIAAITMAVTMLPYLFGYSLTQGRAFMWLGYNLDDSCVYLAWMRQAADGSVRNLNLFTTDPQHGMAPNLVFWALGRFAGLTHLPLLAIYHASRMLFGYALLLLVWKLIQLLIAPSHARRLAFVYVCFSSGLGWLFSLWGSAAPVDMWQPEAITFLSLYLSPLFCFSLFLQAAMIYLLLLAERKRSISLAVVAGICGFLLGMVHTYDVITMTAIWSVFLITSTAARVRRKDSAINILAPWARALIAGLITLPAVAYVAYQLKTEIVFQERANVETLAPAFMWVAMGYGLTLVLAILGGVAARDREPSGEQSSPECGWTTGRDATELLVIWMIVNVAAAYLPFSFQRKLMQGAHLPIAMLAGIGGAWILAHLGRRLANVKFAVFALLTVAILCPTNILFLWRDGANYVRGTSQTGLHRTYLQPGEIAALDWIRAHSPAGTAVQPLPWVGRVVDGSRISIFPRDAALMCFTPGLIGRPVYCGHWGETPSYRSKVTDLCTYVTASRKMTEQQRLALVRSMHVRFLVFSQKRASETSDQTAEDTDALLPRFRGRLPVPDYLRLCHSNADADVYEVLP